MYVWNTYKHMCSNFVATESKKCSKFDIWITPTGQLCTCKILCGRTKQKNCCFTCFLVCPPLQTRNFKCKVLLKLSVFYLLVLLAFFLIFFSIGCHFMNSICSSQWMCVCVCQSKRREWAASCRHLWNYVVSSMYWRVNWLMDCVAQVKPFHTDLTSIQTSTTWFTCRLSYCTDGRQCWSRNIICQQKGKKKQKMFSVGCKRDQHFECQIISSNAANLPSAFPWKTSGTFFK